MLVNLVLTFLEGGVQLDTLPLQTASGQACAALRNAKGIK